MYEKYQFNKFLQEQARVKNHWKFARKKWLYYKEKWDIQFFLEGNLPTTYLKNTYIRKRPWTCSERYYILKYVCTGINAYLKNQVENHSKIDNDVNSQDSKIFKSNLSKACKEKRYNMIYISRSK